MSANDTPPTARTRENRSAARALPFEVGIVIGPGFIPMDMIGVQTVFGLMPRARIHLLWKTPHLVEGIPNWWTKPTTTFADSPAKLQVLAVPMLSPEAQNDPDVIAFVRDKARTASYVIGICNGILLLGAAGILKGRRVTASHNALPVLSELGAREIVPGGHGTVVDGNLYTAGPGVGSFEASLLAAEQAFGRKTVEFAELMMEYDPHPPFGTGTAKRAGPELVSRLESGMRPLINEYRRGAVASYRAL